MNEKLVILGADGTGLLMADSIGRMTEPELLGFLDDDPDKQAEGYCGYKVLAGLKAWKQLPRDVRFLCSLYGPKNNGFFFDLIASLEIPEDRWATVVDPSSVVSASASLSPGAYVGPASVVEPMASIGPRAVMLGSCHLAHHSRLDQHVCCANSVSIAGRVCVCEAAFIGANAGIRESVTIGPQAVVGIGSVVLEDVPGGAVVVSNPARPIRRGHSSA